MCMYAIMGSALREGAKVGTGALRRLLGADGHEVISTDQRDAEVIPLDRLRRKPEEVAAASMFLFSEEASFVNGTTLFVDGGHGTSLRPDAQESSASSSGYESTRTRSRRL